MIITDHLGRNFKTLRLSLTNTCNMACSYCVNEIEGKKKISPQKGLTFNELVSICERLHQQLDLNAIRLTGGEPTIYPDIIPMAMALKALGIKLKLTTNGLMLSELLQKLPPSTFDAINISLDAMDEDIFFTISRKRGLNRVLKGIETARKYCKKVKLNAVIVNGLNQNQVLPLLEFSMKEGIQIRFLETMKMGHLFDKNEYGFYAEEKILNQIATKHPFIALEREISATAHYFKTETNYIFGIIANESNPFCSDCNRLRLDSFGNIYGCLSNNSPVPIGEIYQNDTLLSKALQNALAQKQSVRFQGSKLSMLTIGG